ncbi:MAG TPA: glutamyl-tRNA reductase [Polyangia bacterium]|nr:glutamyl-tRNA reductase [Polyangia bacterium]
MPRQLGIVGLSHKTAPIDVRERVAFAEDALAEALRRLVEVPGIGEAMIVSTCNRVELYAGVDGRDAIEALQRFLIDERSLPSSLRAHLYTHDGNEALRHLFRVAASLDSMVVGESQILGQVKEAYAAALEAGTLGPVLQRAVPRAFALAKRVRTETDVAKSSASIASAAVDLAAQIFGELEGKHVLVVGAGKMGDLSARHLKAAGISELSVVNRTEARAVELAAKLGGRAAPWDQLDQLLAKVDIVLCSTGATEPILRRDRVAKVMRARKGRWLFLIDIAVPRDVEPDVGSVENVYLYDVDALEKVVAQNRAARASEATEAEAMVDDELKRYHEHELSLGAVPTIKLLRARFLEVALAEVERSAARASSEKDRAAMQQMAEAIVNKLLHGPLTKLKKDAAERPDSELPALVRTLFDLHTGHTEEIRIDLDEPADKKAAK